jgi:hypothetical protein
MFSGSIWNVTLDVSNIRRVNTSYVWALWTVTTTNNTPDYIVINL